MKEEGERVKAKQEELDAVKVNFTKVESQLARQELVVLTGSIYTHRQYLHSPAVSLLGGGCRGDGAQGGDQPTGACMVGLRQGVGPALSGFSDITSCAGCGKVF